jgi:hypothetical protein
MKYGDYTVDLKFTVEFSNDGSDSEITDASIGDVILPKALADRILMALGAKQQAAIVDGAWEEAEPKNTADYEDSHEDLDLG